MKSAAIALVCCGLWVSPSAQSIPVAYSASIPHLTLPSGAASGGSGGSGSDGQVGIGLTSAHQHNRLLTELPAAAIVDHYEAQLAAGGWKVAFKKTEPALGLVRFSAGTPATPLTGMLIVVPFEAGKQTLVSVRLIQDRWPWKGRAPQPSTAKFASQQLEFPLSVLRAEFVGASGKPNFMLHEMRLQSADGPAALVRHFESRLPRNGWTVSARVGDRTQSVIRRDLMPDPETDSSEVWMLTSTTGKDEIDFVCMTIQTWRRR